LQILQVSNSDSATSHVVGSLCFHIHDIVAVSPVSGMFDLWDQHQLIGDMSLEITFNYGTFGYGYSPQVFVLNFFVLLHEME
jgi:hypothetical protein